MKKSPGKRPRSARVSEDDILPECDFSQGRRNVYADRFPRDAVVVILDSDVAQLFPDSHAVNDALRALGRIAQRAPGKSRSKHSEQPGR